MDKLSALFRNTLLAPPILDYYGPSWVFTDRSTHIPEITTLIARPVNMNINGYTHQDTTEVFRIRLFNKNPKPITASDLDANTDGALFEILSQMDIIVDVVDTTTDGAAACLLLNTPGKNPISAVVEHLMGIRIFLFTMNNNPIMNSLLKDEVVLTDTVVLK